MGDWLSCLWPSYREVTVDGARARYLCCGSGPPLLLLASPLALGRSYQHAMRALCRSFTVVCVELPGSGGSERLAEPWSVERYAEWTLELLRYLPLAAPVVVGHAGSSAIAAALAALAPSEIGGLVLVDSPVTALPALGSADGVPTLRATLRRDDWAIRAADVEPFSTAIRRFVAAVHRPLLVAAT